MRTIISQIPSGLRHMRGLYCVYIGYPWLSRGAIIALEEILSPDFSVLELGCGGSTVFFANKCKKVKSFDFDQVWVDKVRERIGDKDGVEFVCGDHDYVLDMVKKEPDGAYDVALVDIGHVIPLRKDIAYACMPKVRRGGYLVVDNYEAEGIRGLDHTGWEVYTFDDFVNYRSKLKVHGGRGTQILIKR